MSTTITDEIMEQLITHPVVNMELFDRLLSLSTPEPEPHHHSFLSPVNQKTKRRKGGGKRRAKTKKRRS